MSIKPLKYYQTYSAEYLSHFNFNKVYYPGNAGRYPDALPQQGMNASLNNG
jgi:hypothetical protein